jgi:ADP-ribosylglycohydrolase
MKPPIANSYWVEPGRLLAGEHPDGVEEQLTRQRILQLVEAGVNTFVDLTELHEIDSYRQWLPAGVDYRNFPMLDHAAPDSPQIMRELQISLSQSLTAGHCVYVHCRAGIGRTGMAVGCYLREQGFGAETALNELNLLWKQNARAARWPRIPENMEQADFIRSWQPIGSITGEFRQISSADELRARPLQRYRGSLVALAVGDLAGTRQALGSTPGWPDDTAMTVCVVESLLDKSAFDGRDQLEKYRAWVVSVDDATARSIRASLKDVLSLAVQGRATLTGSHDPTRTDPGPLARCAAPALYSCGDLHRASALGADVARVTHQTPLVVDVCRLFTCMIAAALMGRSKEQIVAVREGLGGIPLRDEVSMLAQQWLQPKVGRRRPPADILGCLDRAVRAFARSTDFTTGLERALAQAKDSDATAAAYGALAGAYYGESNIPAAMRTDVVQVARLELLADRLYLRSTVGVL